MKCILIFALISFNFHFTLIFTSTPDNPLFKSTDDYKQVLSSHDLDFNQNCELKQGFLGYITQIQQDEGLTARPAFIVLNKKIISIFENENASSLIKTIDLKYINYPLIPKKWKNLLCFQIPLDSSGPHYLYNPKSSIIDDTHEEENIIGVSSQFKEIDNYDDTADDINDKKIYDNEIDNKEIADNEIFDENKESIKKHKGKFIKDNEIDANEKYENGYKNKGFHVKNIKKLINDHNIMADNDERDEHNYENEKKGYRMKHRENTNKTKESINKSGNSSKKTPDIPEENKENIKKTQEINDEPVENLNKTNEFTKKTNEITNKTLEIQPLLNNKLPIKKFSLNIDNNPDILGSFCALEKTTLLDWIKSIVDFHNCLLKEISNKEVKSKPLRQLYAVEPRNPSFFDSNVRDELDKELFKLKQDVIKDKLQEEKERNRLENERKKIEHKTRKLEQQQRILSRALQTKAIEEEKIAEVLIKQEESYKRNIILEQTRKALINETHNEKSMLIRQEEQLLKAEKSLQDQIKNMMVQSSYDFEKLLDYGDCYKIELTGGNTTYIKETCYKFIEPNNKPNPENLVACLDRTRFCEQCCDYFIGTSHETARFKCRKKCDNVVYPPFNVKTDSAYVLTVPLKNMIPTSNLNQTFNYTPNNNSFSNNNQSFYISTGNAYNNSLGIALDPNNKIERDRNVSINSNISSFIR